jgi:hypothetical protein
MMTANKTNACCCDYLHCVVDERIREKAAWIPKNLEAFSPEEARQLIHELRVHQIELELQNEKGRRAQMELEASHLQAFQQKPVTIKDVVS